MRPLQAYDAGGQARALSGIAQALGAAKETRLSPSELAQALSIVDWAER